MTRRFWMVAALLVAACATLPTRPTTPLVMGTIVIALLTRYVKEGLDRQ